jgi:hypothetical protein
MKKNADELYLGNEKIFNEFDIDKKNKSKLLKDRI